jgi:hypothetical protein
MSQNFHTPIVLGSPANAATFNSVHEELDSGIGIQGGGTNATNNYLLNYWMVTVNRIISLLTDDPDGFITGADIMWPDGSTGIYSVTTKDPVWLEAVAWNVTHDLSNKRLVFSGLTRDSEGRIINPGSFSIQSI